jgi:DNA (cytosine-5)-methyltransferase 1
MRYGSVCSGIEAATVAWEPLGFEAAWFSEIEKFPSKVLAHHYPTPNLGDMTQLLENETFINEHIDILVGGTPCQAFSIAGLRKGLDDERGNLSLTYIRLLERKRPTFFLWENVPGVLSSNEGADFASILSGWTGLDIEPQKFSKAGVIEGEFYSVAWRILDAQYFGVPQRRRRIFVVGYLGKNWRPPYAVLFEQESLRGDSKKGRKARQETTQKAGGSINCTSEGIAGTVSSKWAKGTGGPAGDEHYNLIVDYGSHWDNPNNPHPTLNQSSSVSGGVGGSNQEVFAQRGAYLVEAPVCYSEVQVTSKVNGSNPQPGDPCYTLPTDTRAPIMVTSIARRLTPIECERLQGFPDNWTKLPRYKKDGPRYKAIGNSMAVPVMRWIGRRIKLLNEVLNVQECDASKAK